jgi:hypothetical protein
VTRGRAALALALVAALGVALAVILLRDDHEATGPRIALPQELPIAAGTTLDPRVLLFGDTLQATVDVTYDRRKVNGDSIKLAPDFASWETVAPTVRERHVAGDEGYLHVTYTMRCEIGPCVPQGGTAKLEFDPVKVSYLAVGGKKRSSVDAHWAVLVTHSQLVTDDFENRQAANTPWRADAVTLPAVSYRVAPRLVRGVAFGVGALLAVVGIVLAVLAIPRRAPRPEPEPEPEEPEPMLPPLEHALVLLEADVRSNGGADQRRALELVAEELEARAEWPLARRARRMAWAEDVPAVTQTRGLATEVRAAIVVDGPEELEGSGEEEGDAPA